jgi:hypothetical protein
MNFVHFLEDDLERECTMEDIEQMTYLDCCIKVNDHISINLRLNYFLIQFRKVCVSFHQFQLFLEKYKKTLFIVSSELNIEDQT